jgi:hypothetical protein
MRKLLDLILTVSSAVFALSFVTILVMAPDCDQPTKPWQTEVLTVMYYACLASMPVSIVTMIISSQLKK